MINPFLININDGSENATFISLKIKNTLTDLSVKKWTRYEKFVFALKLF